MQIDAVLVLGFGGPERTEDVMPFLENVTRGRGIPRERLLGVAEHYYALGGRSPINDQNRALTEALAKELVERGPQVPVYWGNRNWAPYVEDVVGQMAADGIRHAAAFATAAYAGFSSCRQYRQDIARAREAAGPAAPRLTKLRHFFDHPGFVNPMVRSVRAALDALPAGLTDGAEIVFTAHSVPLAAAQIAGPTGGMYQAQLLATCKLVAAGLGGGNPWRLVWQSRSGDGRTPWLEPDVSDVLTGIGAAGGRAVVVVPVGFISDHVEVLHDLDDEAAEAAREAGLAFSRAATVGVDPEFVAMVGSLVRELADPLAPRLGLGDPDLHWDECPTGCCQAWRPAVAG